MSGPLFKRWLAKCGQTITLQDRAIESPAGGFVDFTEQFTEAAQVPAIISTPRGKTLFDGVATDRPITHRLAIEYLTGVTAETWVQLADGRRLDILDVENKGEQNECLILLCTMTGTGEAARA